MYYKYVEFLKLWKGGEMFANVFYSAVPNTH